MSTSKKIIVATLFIVILIHVLSIDFQHPFNIVTNLSPYAGILGMILVAILMLGGSKNKVE